MKYDIRKKPEKIRPHNNLIEDTIYFNNLLYLRKVS